jgi:hypothetical protein
MLLCVVIAEKGCQTNQLHLNIHIYSEELPIQSLQTRVHAAEWPATRKVGGHPNTSSDDR